MNYTRNTIYGPVHIRYIRRSDCRAGFDLSSFHDSSVFKQLLKRFKLSSYKRHSSPIPHTKLKVYYTYTWSNASVMLVTGNNPLTGVYSVPSARAKEKGYASYIGIEGKCPIVHQLFDYIKAHATVGGENMGEREFI